MWGEVRWGTVRRGEVRWGTVRQGEVRWGDVRRGEVRCGAVRWGEVRWGDVRCGPTWQTVWRQIVTEWTAVRHNSSHIASVLYVSAFLGHLQGSIGQRKAQNCLIMWHRWNCGGNKQLYTWLIIILPTAYIKRLVSVEEQGRCFKASDWKATASARGLRQSEVSCVNHDDLWRAWRFNSTQYWNWHYLKNCLSEVNMSVMSVMSVRQLCQLSDVVANTATQNATWVQYGKRLNAHSCGRNVL
jgi:hypothetical protein